jgi:integrase
MIVVLWRAGLRIQEALTLAEHDLDRRRGSILIRHGKGGRRREVAVVSAAAPRAPASDDQGGRRSRGNAVERGSSSLARRGRRGRRGGG